MPELIDEAINTFTKNWKRFYFYILSISLLILKIMTDIEEAKMERIMTWKEIDSRFLPNWYDKAKFGIFIHWGLYSVPAFAPLREEIGGSGATYSEWYGYHLKRGFRPYVEFHEKNFKGLNYENFADLWKAELFNADEWAKLFAESGAKYLCLVSKHHDGFCLFDSSYSKSWNSLCMGPKRDITEELLTACEKRGIHRGVYYSLLEWEHPISGEHGEHENYVVNKMIPEMKELVEKYQPELIFTDGEWDTDSETWHSREFLSYLIEESPVRKTVVFNDRWGKDTRGQHGGYLTTEYGEVNSTLLKEQEAQSNLKNRKWEECRSLSHSFGFNRREGLHHYLTEKQMIELLTDTVAKGGNLLLNVAPNADGSISPLIQERLQQMGNWMKINGEAIYGTKPLSIQNSLNAKATKKANTIFLFLKTYVTEEMTVHAKRVRSVELLGYGTLPFRECSESISFSLPAVGIDKYPLKNVFTVKISLL